MTTVHKSTKNSDIPNPTNEDAGNCANDDVGNKNESLLFSNDDDDTVTESSIHDK